MVEIEVVRDDEVAAKKRETEQEVA